jgi:hypothetical protein
MGQVRLPADLLSSRRIDAISANGFVDPFGSVGLYRRDALENCRVDRKRRFLDSFLSPMDRLGTREKEYYPGRVLGMQSPWQPLSSQLLSFLPARFGRGDHDHDANPSLYQEPLPEMEGGSFRKAN